MEKRYYHFGGFGNFSHWYNWDNGISVSVDKEPMTWEEAVKYMKEDTRGAGSDFINLDLPEEFGSYHEYFFNEHGGSRNVRGFICARNYEEAEKVAVEIEKSYPVIEYEPEEEDYEEIEEEE